MNAENCGRFTGYLSQRPHFYRIKNTNDLYEYNAIIRVTSSPKQNLHRTTSYFKVFIDRGRRQIGSILYRMPIGSPISIQYHIESWRKPGTGYIRTTLSADYVRPLQSLPA